MAKPQITRTATHPATGEKVTYTGTRDVKWATFDRGARGVDGKIRVAPADEAWRHVGWSSATTEKGAKAAGRSTSVYGVEYMAVPVDAEPETAVDMDALRAEAIVEDAEREAKIEAKVSQALTSIARSLSAAAPIAADTATASPWNPAGGQRVRDRRDHARHGVTSSFYRTSDEAVQYFDVRWDGQHGYSWTSECDVEPVEAAPAYCGSNDAHDAHGVCGGSTVDVPEWFSVAELQAPHVYRRSEHIEGVCGICGQEPTEPRHITLARAFDADLPAGAQLGEVGDDEHLHELSWSVERVAAELTPAMIRALALAAGRPQSLSTTVTPGTWAALVTRRLLVAAQRPADRKPTERGVMALHLLGVVGIDEVRGLLAQAARDGVEVWVARPARECCEGDEFGHADTCVQRPAEVEQLAERVAGMFADADEDAPPTDRDLDRIVSEIISAAASPDGDQCPDWAPGEQHARDMIAWCERILVRRREQLALVERLAEGVEARLLTAPLWQAWLAGHARANMRASVADWKRGLDKRVREFERDYGRPYASESTSAPTCVATEFSTAHAFDGSPRDEAYRAEFELCDKSEGDPIHAPATVEPEPVVEVVHLVGVDSAACPATLAASWTSVPAAVNCALCLDALWAGHAAGSVDLGDLRRVAEGVDPAPRVLATDLAAARKLLAGLTSGPVIEARLVRVVEPTRDEVPDEPADLPHRG